jgi:hypothetical protein
MMRLGFCEGSLPQVATHTQLVGWTALDAACLMADRALTITTPLRGIPVTMTQRVIRRALEERQRRAARRHRTARLIALGGALAGAVLAIWAAGSDEEPS